jgi:F-type H+-transporting ATPase subunit b
MLIDWVTVVAQIINFLILVYLLKRFLYGPIVQAMNEREERIREQIEQADRARAEAEERAGALEREREELERRREELMDEARQEVRQWKDQALERVKDEIEQSRQTWMEGLSLEKERTRSRIRKTLSEQVLIVSRKVLNDLADGSLERSAVEQFLRRLEQARNEQGESFDSTGEIHFELGFDSPEHQEMIRSRLSGIFGSREQVRAKVNPELGFGIMVRAGDRKWDWTLSRYLQDLERTLFDQLSAVASGVRQ